MMSYINISRTIETHQGIKTLSNFFDVPAKEAINDAGNMINKGNVLKNRLIER